MRLINLMIIAGFFMGCSASKVLEKKEKNSEYPESETKSDTSMAQRSNYAIFNYFNSLDADDYYTLLDSIQKGTSTDYFTLRMAFTKTKNWLPYDTEISQKHKEINSLIGSAKYDEALKISDSILDKNYVEIETQLINGYLYKLLGDTVRSVFHYRIYEELLKSIYTSGDGKSAKTAFIVISTDEEYVFLRWFNLQSAGQSLLSEDGHSFDLLKAIDQETKEEFDIYFNIDLPFSYLSSAFK
jgi:hypothetical protein